MIGFQSRSKIMKRQIFVLVIILIVLIIISIIIRAVLINYFRFSRIKSELERRANIKIESRFCELANLFDDVIKIGMSKNEVHSLIFGYDDMRKGEIERKNGKFNFEEYRFQLFFDTFLYVEYNSDNEVRYVATQ